jgi:hypothetical protein
VLLSGHFKNPVANKIFGVFREFQLLCTTKDHLNTIGLGPVTFDYFSMEPTGLVLDNKWILHLDVAKSYSETLTINPQWCTPDTSETIKTIHRFGSFQSLH